MGKTEILAAARAAAHLKRSAKRAELGKRLEKARAIKRLRSLQYMMRVLRAACEGREGSRKYMPSAFRHLWVPRPRLGLRHDVPAPPTTPGSGAISPAIWGALGSPMITPLSLTPCEPSEASEDSDWTSESLDILELLEEEENRQWAAEEEEETSEESSTVLDPSSISLGSISREETRHIQELGKLFGALPGCSEVAEPALKRLPIPLEPQTPVTYPPSRDPQLHPDEIDDYSELSESEAYPKALRVWARCNCGQQEYFDWDVTEHQNDGYNQWKDNCTHDELVAAMTKIAAKASRSWEPNRIEHWKAFREELQRCHGCEW